MSPRKCNCTVACSSSVAAVVGVLVVVLGAVLIVCMPTFIRSLVASRKELSPGNDAFGMWLHAPVPIYRKFYVFNVTNHEEYLATGAKPNLQQLGPYTYRQYEDKEEVVVDDEDDTLSYRNKKTFVYLPEASEGSLDDVVIVPNIPAASIVEKVNETDYLLISILLNSTGTTAFVNVTVGQFLFDGYKDAFVDLIQTFRGETILPDAKFGLMYGHNNTDDGIYKIKRGRLDPKQYGKIVEFRNDTSLKVWGGHYCNMFNGTDGRISPSLTAEDDMVYVFSSDICRSMGLRFKGKTDFKGVPVLRYILDGSLMADENTNPDNQCFCMTPGRCLPSGTLSLATCRNGAPLHMSAPHFLYASYDYLRTVDGLKPIVDSHISFMEIEPVTGMVMRATRRMQLNLYLRNNAEITMYENVTDVLLPFAWIDENAEVNDQIVSMIAGAHSSLSIANILPIVVTAVGAVTVFVASLVAFVLLHRFSSALSQQGFSSSSGMKRSNKYSLSH